METSAPAAASAPLDLSRIAQDLQIRKVHVENIVQLLDEGNAVSFIARFRRERTGGLGEDVIRRIKYRVGLLRQLLERKQVVLKTIENQGAITEELRAAIISAENPKRLEDLFLAYKPKRRSSASEAREKGLEPLAAAIWKQDPVAANLPDVLQGMINPEKQLNTIEDVANGAKSILAEIISEQAEVRGAIRAVLWETGKIASVRNPNLPENRGQEYKSYFEFKESVQEIPPHRILAINRGEKEEALKVSIEYDSARVEHAARAAAPFDSHPHRELLEAARTDAITKIVLPSLQREIRRDLTDFAQEHAATIFGRNLRALLLQRPLHAKRLLAIDPGLRGGCRLAVLDEEGNPVEHATVYPNQPFNRKQDAKIKLEELIRKHQLTVIALGNGTGCRDTEKLLAELIADFEAGKSSQDSAAAPSPESPPPSNDAPAIADNPQPASTESLHVAEAAHLVAEVEAASAVPLLEPSAVALAEPNSHPEAAAEQAALAEPNSHPEAAAEQAALAEPNPNPEAAAEQAAPAEPNPNPEAAAGQAAPAAEAVATMPTPETTPRKEPRPAPQGPPPQPPIDLSVLPPPPKEIAYVIVNEAGASDYSTSQVAREEFPDLDSALRATISIGRRLQDPLREMVKIDPQHIGVGLYQHDVRHRHLKESLEAVVESCVNLVGVDLNMATVPLLRFISGLNPLAARDVIEYRKQHGPFRSREQLKQVTSLGDKRFVQAAGFLRIVGGENPLDNSWLHPEHYPIAQAILADIGCNGLDLGDPEKLDSVRDKLKKVHPEVYAAQTNANLSAVKEVLDLLANPARDPREDQPLPIFRKGILKIEDLTPGMELKGTVLNVVDFGAFVDIGLKDSGLVHISQIANRYIKNPYEVLAVGDVVTVWIRSVDMERRHVSLTMIPPGAERKPGERRQAPLQPAAEQAAQPGQERPRGHRRGGRPPRGDQRRQGVPPQPGAGAAPAVAAQAPPPPAKPHRPPPKPKPLPKLSTAALTGKTPLHSFGELEAFFKAKTDDPKPAETPPPAAG